MAGLGGEMPLWCCLFTVGEKNDCYEGRITWILQENNHTRLLDAIQEQVSDAISDFYFWKLNTDSYGCSAEMFM